MSIRIEYACNAKCRPDHIWSVFEKIEDWPRWDPESLRSVRWVSGEPWTRGAKFEVAIARPIELSITPELMDIDAPVFVHVKGHGKGVTGEQFYVFKWMPESNETEMHTMQEFSGPTVMLFGKKIKPALEVGIRHMFERLREEAEARCRAEVSSEPSV